MSLTPTHAQTLEEAEPPRPVVSRYTAFEKVLSQLNPEGRSELQQDKAAASRRTPQLGLATEQNGPQAKQVTAQRDPNLVESRLAGETGREIPLRVMTYNLKFASEKHTTHPWSARRALVKAIILEQNPDILGTQEGLYGQLNDLARDLPGYGWIGQGREGQNKGEFTAVFYKAARFQPLDYGFFWLSSTPEVAGSRSWGNYIPRMATWVLFRDRQSGAEFYHFNTHFDHLIPYARSRSAQLLRERIAGRALGRPVIVTGDFNTPQSSKAHRTLVAAEGNVLFDSWEAARVNEGLGVSTFHNWHGPKAGNRRIDWILASADFSCNRSRVVLEQKDGQWPSDHFPVVSEFSLSAGPAAVPAPVIVDAPIKGEGVRMTGALASAGRAS